MQDTCAYLKIQKHNTISTLESLKPNWKNPLKYSVHFYFLQNIWKCQSYELI